MDRRTEWVPGPVDRYPERSLAILRALPNEWDAAVAGSVEDCHHTERTKRKPGHACRYGYLVPAWALYAHGFRVSWVASMEVMEDEFAREVYLDRARYAFEVALRGK